MNSQEAVLDIIIELEADIIQRIEIMEKCFNKEEKLNETINSYIDGERNWYFNDIEDCLKDIPIIDPLNNNIEIAINDLTVKASNAEKLYNSENLDLIPLIIDCLEFIRSITLSIRLQDSLNNYKNEIKIVNSSLIRAFEKIRIKLNNDFNKMLHLNIYDLQKNLNWLEFDRMSDNNYEKLIRFSRSISFLEKHALAEHDKNVDLMESLNEIEDEINDEIEKAREFVSERIDELIKIYENLNILFNDFDSNIKVDTIELLDKNKELLSESSTGNTIVCIKNNDYKGAIVEFEMTYKYWIYDDGNQGVLSRFLDILDDNAI